MSRLAEEEAKVCHRRAEGHLLRSPRCLHRNCIDAPRAHLRRARPEAQDRLREQARATGEDSAAGMTEMEAVRGHRGSRRGEAAASLAPFRAVALRARRAAALGVSGASRRSSAVARRRPVTGMPTSVAWLATAAKRQAVITTKMAVTRASSRGGKDLLLGAARRRLPAHPEHAAPRPQRVRPSVRWMNSTSVDRGWKERALLAASASMGDAPGAKLNR